MKKRHLGLAALAIAAAAGSASAHHAFNMFENDKYTTINGTVKSFTWHNPPAMLEMVAPAAGGQPEQAWTVELSAPNIIGRRGWSRDVLKVGDKVPVTFHPMKDGSRYGLMVSVTTASGTFKDKM
jgi:hypothetical protein